MVERSELLINIRKYNIPIVYLDSNIMIELSKIYKNSCKDVHKANLTALLGCMLALLANKRVLCPLGAQLDEMGMSYGRTEGMEFLYHFTNAEFFLPEYADEMEHDIAKQAYCEQGKNIRLDVDKMLKWTAFTAGPIINHVAMLRTQEETEEYAGRKRKTVDILNSMKKNGSIEKDYESQLQTELKSEADMMIEDIGIMGAFLSAPDIFDDAKKKQLFEAEIRLCNILKTLPSDRFEDILWAAIKHHEFLLSEYHHKIPYVDITSTLWAHRMQQSNKIVQGDRMDTMWAAAYLPFIDYAITDKAFCRLLNESGLAKKYGVQVYDIGTIGQFIKDITEKVYSNPQIT